MRIVAVVLLALAFVAAACAPQASGPPESAQTVSAPASDETPAAMPGSHPGMPGEMPSGHPEVSTGASPPPGHMAGGGMNITETDGAVVSVKDQEMILARPSGTELRFQLAPDVKFLPEGKSREDLKEGARVKLQVRTPESGGMEATAIEFQDLPPATK